MCMRAQSFLAVFCLICVVQAGAISGGQIANGLFEVKDFDRPNLFYNPPHYPAADWFWENELNNIQYVAVHSEFYPISERGAVDWDIPAPFFGEHFVLLSTGDAEGRGSESLTLYSSIEQIITLNEGDVILGSYFFGTTDYTPFNDTGIVELIPTDPNDVRDPIELVYVSVSDVGQFQATDGWQHFEYRISDDEAGEYLLYCEVRDVGDRIFKSYLALDNFRICGDYPFPSDLNRDCRVDYHDFNIISKTWSGISSGDPNEPGDDDGREFYTYTVSDPNDVGSDPNDISDPNGVNLDLLFELSDTWLWEYY